jgi:catalase
MQRRKLKSPALRRRDCSAQYGLVVPENSLTVGPRGPVVFDDILLFDKMAHFNRERIPERVVHAKGSGAHGHFVCTTSDMLKYTTAKSMSAVGKNEALLREVALQDEAGHQELHARRGRRDAGPGSGLVAA